MATGQTEYPKEIYLDKLIVRKAAVLGAGVIGAQIAVHLADANVPVVLFDRKRPADPLLPHVSA